MVGVEMVMRNLERRRHTGRVTFLFWARRAPTWSQYKFRWKLPPQGKTGRGEISRCLRLLRIFR